MQAHLVLEARVKSSDLQYVSNELAKLECPRLNRRIRICDTELIWIVVSHKKNAAPRWRDYVVKRVKILPECLLCPFALIRKTGVRHGLAAARLIGRILHVTSEFLQQLKRRNSYLWIELVNVTGNKQADFQRM